MIFLKNELKELFPFYLYYFVLGLSAMIFPFMTLYFIEIGLSFTQIGMLLAIFSLSVVLLEIPTGAIADGISRKYSVLFGLCIAAVSVVAISFTTEFFVLLLLFFLLGIGLAFTTGAEDAWVIDNLRKKKKSHLIDEFYIKMQSIASLGLVFAPLIGAVIVSQFGITPLWIIWGLGFFLGAVVLVFVREHFIPKKEPITLMMHSSVKNIHKGLVFSIKKKHIFFLMLAFVSFSLTTVDSDFWQPFLVDLELPTFMVGLLFSLVAVVSTIIPFIARSLKNISITKAVSIIALIRIAVISSVLFLYPGLFMLGAVVFVFTQSIHHLRYPILEPYFQKKVPSSIRATVSSVKSMVNQTGIGLMTLFAGVLADYIGLSNTIFFTSLFGILGAYFLWLSTRQSGK